MARKNDDTGEILVLLKRMNRIRIPRALELQKKVQAGKVLGDLDIAFLERVLADSRYATVLADRHSDLQPLAAKLIALYSEITRLALENEQRKKND